MTNSVRGFGAKGDGTTNDSNAIQNAINATQARGGGIVRVEPGSYYCPGLTLPAGVTLEGEGQNICALQSLSSNNPVVTLTAGLNNGLKNLSIFGYNSPSATTNAVVINPGVVGAVLRDLTIWLGYSALFIQGIDCDIDNCFIGNSYHNAAIVSNGANWYRRCKIDSQAAAVVGGKPPAPYTGFLQGTSIEGVISENHFEMCDFSGDAYDRSILIGDPGNNAMFDFSGCVFSHAITITGSLCTIIRGCELGGDVSNTSSGKLIFGMNIAIGRTVNVHGATVNTANSGFVFT